MGRAIESALDQDVPGGVEVIVVDDESTDDTRAVVARFGERVQYLWQRNAREGAARNFGAARARGAFLAFLDSDDYYLPGKLAGDLARLGAADQPALVYSRAFNVDEHDHPLGARQLRAPEGDIFWALARENCIPMSTAILRASAFRELGGFGESRALSGTADWELWMRLAARWRVGFAEQRATCIRVTSNSMLHTAGYMARGNLAALDAILADPVVAARVGGRGGEVRSHLYVTTALNAYANRQRRQSAAWLLRALRAWPRQALTSRFLGAASRALVGRRIVERLAAARGLARTSPGAGPWR